MYEIGTRVGIVGFRLDTHEVVGIEEWKGTRRYRICPVERLADIRPGQVTVPVSMITAERLQTRSEADGPSDDEIYNGPGREGGIAFGPDNEPGSLGENDWRL